MDSLVEVTDVFRKASLASIGKPEIIISKLGKEEPKPKDKFFLVHILFGLFGLLHVLPITFFITANDYWMYKFRNTAYETVDSNNRTTLQTYFSSGSMIAQAVPSVICMMLSTTLGHKFRVRSRIISTMTVLVTFFAVFSAFIKINTDTWQTGFFVMSMGGLVIINGVLTLFQVSTLSLLPKFPPKYMKSFLFGQGTAGIFNSTLQIISLSIGTTTEVSALFYFISGTLVILSTLVLYLVSKHFEFFQYYVKIHLEDTKKDISKSHARAVFYKIWPCLAIGLLVLLSLVLTHPALTALVVSENYGYGDAWNDKYFVPTITYLFTDSSSLFGRLLARDLIKQSTRFWWVGIVILRVFIFVPLIMFCNVQPRSHLSVLFTHDWEYILILFLFFSTSGYLLNSMFLSIPKMAPGEDEMSFLLMMMSVGVGAGLMSPLSLISVRVV